MKAEQSTEIRWIQPLTVLVLGLWISGCASQSPLVGTWVLLENDIRPQQETPVPSAAELSQRPKKVLTEDHFAFGSQSPDGRVLAGGGTYSYDDHQYTETVEYHWIEGLVGKTIHFECHLDGDRWYHEGRVTAADGRRYHIRETWLRWKSVKGSRP